MNAQNTSIGVLKIKQLGQVAGGAITALVMASIVGGLVVASGLNAGVKSTPSLTAQVPSASYFPAQFEIAPSAKDGSVVEY